MKDTSKAEEFAIREYAKRYPKDWKVSEDEIRELINDKESDEGLLFNLSIELMTDFAEEQNKQIEAINEGISLENFELKKENKELREKIEGVKNSLEFLIPVEELSPEGENLILKCIQKLIYRRLF